MVHHYYLKRDSTVGYLKVLYTSAFIRNMKTEHVITSTIFRYRIGVVAGKDQSLRADERTAASTNETIPYTKKRSTGKINIRIDLITTGSVLGLHLYEQHQIELD
jgi:hypothetical protein